MAKSIENLIIVILSDVYPEASNGFSEIQDNPKSLNIDLSFNHKNKNLNQGMQEWESLESIEYLKKICEQFSKYCLVFTNLLEFFSWLTYLPRIERENVILWNLIEGLQSRSREGYVPAIGEAIGIPCLGSDCYSQVITLDKFLFKSIIPGRISGRFGLGFPTSNSYNKYSISEIYNENYYPIFIKPRFGGSSIGIDILNRIDSQENLDQLIKKIDQSDFLKELDPKFDWIWEEYLPGTEFTVCLLETSSGWIGEAGIVCSPDSVYSESVKSKYSMTEKIYTISNQELKKLIIDESIFIAIENRWEGYARLDWKLDQNGNPILLECNLTPGLSIYYSLYPLVWKIVYGMSYEELIYNIVSIGWQNYLEKKRYHYGKYYQSRIYKNSKITSGRTPNIKASLDRSSET